MAKKKSARETRKKSNAGQRKLAQAKVAIQKSRFPYVVISSVKLSLAPNTYVDFVQWLYREPRLRVRTLPNAFPVDLEELRPFPTPSLLEINKELQWCYAILQPNLAKIADYVSAKRTLDDLFVQNKGEECFAVLDQIEADFGTSLLLLKRRISLLQHFKGLEQQKSYVNSIRDMEDSINGIIPFIMQFTSYRSEPTVSSSMLDNSFEIITSDLHLDNSLECYLRYHILDQYPSSVNECAAVLCIEAAGTAIDAYEALILTFQALLASGRFALRSGLSSMLSDLCNKARDPRLLRLLLMLGKSNSAEILEKNAIPQLHLLFSNPSEKPREESAELECKAESADSRVVYSIINSLRKNTWEDEGLSSSSLLSCIEKSLHGKHGVNGPDMLKHYALCLQSSSTSHLIRLIVMMIQAELFEPHNWQLHVYCLAKVSPADIIWSGDSELDHKYVQTFLSADSSLEPMLLWEEGILAEPTFPISFNQFGLWRMMLYYHRNGNLPEALEYGLKLFEQSIFFLKRQAAKIVSGCMLKLEMYEECVDFVSKSTISDRALIPDHVVVDTYEFLISIEAQSLKRSLACVVLTDLYISLKSDDFRDMRSYAAEDFLQAHSLDRPSQLRAIISEFDETLMLYFLCHIAVESVLDLWIVFNGSQEIAMERTFICQLLSELDPTNKEIYQAEIRDIMSRVTLSKRLREVEQSKIYIDISSIKKAARENLKESIDRYLSFVRTGISPEDKGRLRETRKKVLQGDVEALLAGAFPRNEMSELLESITIRLRDEFVSSNQHGLDGYLSVRVRHGTLAGYLRGPLDNEHLITILDSKTGEYRVNSYWQDHLQIPNQETLDIIQTALSDFSRNFDELIEEIRSKWLQVKKSPSDVGLFDFMLLQPEVDYISTGIREDMSFDAFLEHVFIFLTAEKLEPSLQKVRDALQNQAKPRVIDMLSRLQRRVDRALGARKAVVFRDSIAKARTQLSNTLDRITEWFRLSKSEMFTDPFTVDEAVSICEASIQLSCPEFKAIVHSSEGMDEVYIKAKLPSFVDLLFLIFENAVSHSKMQPHPVIHIIVSFSDERLRIKVTNDLGDDYPIKESRRKIKKIQDGLHKDEFSTSVRTEGGTGFHKMHKILNHDFLSISGNRKPSLEFGIKDKRFHVDISLPVHEWSKEGI